MANPEHVAILLSGRKKWNAWRDANPDVKPDLSRAKLRYEKLMEYDLKGADFSSADLHAAYLIEANLYKADLTCANLTSCLLVRADLQEAHLSQADMTGANLNGANLKYTRVDSAMFIDADLSHANLFGVDMNQVKLNDANFDFTVFDFTSISYCDSLHLTRNLDTALHIDGSTLDHYTLRACFKGLPRSFLWGVGYSDEEILAFTELYGKGLEFYSCFISHTAEDDEFVNKLHQDLQNNNVRCWHYRYNATVGKPMSFEIKQAIRMWDKTVVVCSERALNRENVVKEIIEAIQLEDESKKRKLFPIRIDDYLFSQELKRIEAKNVRDGLWESEWVDRVRDIVVADFRDWNDHGKYQPEFERVLKALRAK